MPGSRVHPVRTYLQMVEMDSTRKTMLTQPVFLLFFLPCVFFHSTTDTSGSPLLLL
jgi:hypothetical protein